MAAGLALTAMVPGFAEAAAPKKAEFTYEYGKDVSAWYWRRQTNQEVTTPPQVPPIPGAPPVSQRVTLPNPQRPDTLPVALNQGQPDKMSGIKFDLLERGVVENSKINELVFFIEESQDRNEHPQMRPETAKINACVIKDVISAGENEEFDDAPKHDDSSCVEGKREAPASGSTGPAIWTFDLTKTAANWGKNPFENNGVMLVPVAVGTETWQVNLKIPARDAAATTDNEYESTKGRTKVNLTFIPGKPTKLVTPPVPPDPTTTTTTTGTTGTTGTVGTTPVQPSTDFGAEEIPGAEPVAAPPPVTEPAAVQFPQDQGRQMPAYVWLAIPLGLLALTAVRSVILEPVGGPRPDGVISAIRQRNAQRRGGVLRQPSDPISRMVGAFRRAGAGSRAAIRKRSAKR